jgi:predicted nucleic acid-binding protein
VKIIVDANLVFSGILNTNSKVGDLLINSYPLLDFIAPDFLRIEIQRHEKKLAKISGLTVEQILEVEFLVCKDIKFISEEQISNVNWELAYGLVKDIDPKDVQYVAFSLQFKRKVWSGDKKLTRGLTKKGFSDWVTTEELYRIREALKKSRRK